MGVEQSRSLRFFRFEGSLKFQDQEGPATGRLAPFAEDGGSYLKSRCRSPEGPAA